MLVIFAASACKKEGGNKHETAYRIKKIQNGAEYKNFTYDNQRRVSRIDFNTGSFQFMYSTNEIVVQTYATDGAPDPNWKYVFATENGRIKKGTRYLSTGTIGRNYTYAYDDNNRLRLTYMSLKDFNGDEAEDHRYYFSYDAQNNVQQIAYTRASWIGSERVNNDSISASFGYYADKPFIKWKQVGFDFFGAATGGIQLQGLEIIPFSFLFLENLVLSEKAVQAIDTEKYKWNSLNKSWAAASTSSKTWTETDYGHNDEGLPVKYKTITVEWESYEQ